MTFDNRFMVWAVLNDIKFLNLTNFIMTPKKDVMIEDDLIKSFKFLNLDSNDFSQFIKNKKSSWRYVNYDLSTFFLYKYMANPIKTFNNSKNFSKFFWLPRYAPAPAARALKYFHFKNNK